MSEQAAEAEVDLGTVQQVVLEVAGILLQHENGFAPRPAMQKNLDGGLVTTISNTFLHFYHPADKEHTLRDEQPRARSVDSWERFGVPPCQARMSRIRTLPAGAGQTVLNFIQSGSSFRVGMGSLEC